MTKKIFIFLVSVIVFIVLFFYLDKNNTYGFLVNNSELESIFKNQNEFNKKFLFIYFGYLKCKTFCPSSIGLMKQVSDKIKSDEIKFIFVSIDKENDSKEKLDEYKKNFDKRFYFYSSEELISIKLIKTFKIQFSKNLFEKDLSHHSSNLFFLNKDKTKYLIYPSNYTEISKIINDKNLF